MGEALYWEGTVSISACSTVCFGQTFNEAMRSRTLFLAVVARDGWRSGRCLVGAWGRTAIRAASGWLSSREDFPRYV